jgi:hypothetical protein
MPENPGISEKYPHRFLMMLKIENDKQELQRHLHNLPKYVSSRPHSPSPQQLLDIRVRDNIIDLLP